MPRGEEDTVPSVRVGTTTPDLTLGPGRRPRRMSFRALQTFSSDRSWH